jgi:hypothetical protein
MLSHPAARAPASRSTPQIFEYVAVVCGNMERSISTLIRRIHLGESHLEVPRLAHEQDDAR